MHTDLRTSFLNLIDRVSGLLLYYYARVERGIK